MSSCGPHLVLLFISARLQGRCEPGGLRVRNQDTEFRWCWFLKSLFSFFLSAKRNLTSQTRNWAWSPGKWKKSYKEPKCFQTLKRNGYISMSKTLATTLPPFFNMESCIFGKSHIDKWTWWSAPPPQLLSLLISLLDPAGLSISECSSTALVCCSPLLCNLALLLAEVWASFSARVPPLPISSVP